MRTKGGDGTSTVFFKTKGDGGVVEEVFLKDGCCQVDIGAPSFLFNPSALYGFPHL